MKLLFVESGLPILIVLSFLCTGGKADSLSPANAWEFSGRTMGTTFSVKLVATAAAERAEPNRIERDVEELLHEINRQMSTYIPNSELSLFNRSRDTNWFPVSLELAEVFQHSGCISELSGGAFDITVGALVNLWGFGPDWKRPQIPVQVEIERMRSRAGHWKISARTNPPGVRKSSGDVYCDLSGLAKGYAVDRVGEYLESLCVADYLVEIGGEVRARGGNAAGKAWRIGIRDPEKLDRIRRVVALADRSMATSGDYAQFFEQDGQRYSHTIDPRTGRPVTHRLASVSVLHASCATADGWATALNVLGPEAGYQLAVENELAVLMIVRTRHGYREQMTPRFQSIKSIKSAMKDRAL